MPIQLKSARWLAIGVLCIFGCPANTPMQVPPGEPAVIATTRPGEGQKPASTTVRDLPDSRPDGQACFKGAQCESLACEGGSCNQVTPGTCVSKERICTRDRVPFCGCDGVTFLSSSSCPGELFEHRGACVQNDEDNPDKGDMSAPSSL